MYLNFSAASVIHLFAFLDINKDQVQMVFVVALVLCSIFVFLSAFILLQLIKQKTHESLVIASQKQLTSLINTIDGVVWEGNPQDDTCTYVSDKIYDVLGYTKVEWMHTPACWYNNLHPEDQQTVTNSINEALENKNSLDIEYRIITKYRSVVWIRDIITIVNEPNQPTKLRGIMIDVTSKKTDEAALKKSFDLVTDQNKRLLNFSYIVSHNLRSHAANIQGIVALIETAENDDERKEMVSLLKTSGADLNDTLVNLSQIVTIQSNFDIEIESLNLYDFIQKSLASQSDLMVLKKAEIKIEVKKDLFVLHNHSYLLSILTYFISNALRCNHPDRSLEVVLSTFYENGQLVLSIADNGIGIDLKKHKDKQFDNLTTIDSSYIKGFGSLLVKNQVEAMGGKIEMKSELDLGTEFKIYFK